MPKSNRWVRDVPREVEYQSLSVGSQADIAAVLIDHSDYLSAECWTPTALRELLADLVEPVTVSISECTLTRLLQQVASRDFYEEAVKKLQARLTIVGDLDPVIFDGDDVVDGRHRLEAYARAGRKTISTVDIGALSRTDWERWMNG